MGKELSVLDDKKKKAAQNVYNETGFRQQETDVFEDSGYFMASQLGNSMMREAMGFKSSQNGNHRNGRGGSPGAGLFSQHRMLTPLNSGEAPVQAKKSGNNSQTNAAPSGSEEIGAKPSSHFDSIMGAGKRKLTEKFGKGGSALKEKADSDGRFSSLADETWSPGFFEKWFSRAEKNVDKRNFEILDVLESKKSSQDDVRDALSADRDKWMADKLNAEEALTLLDYTGENYETYNKVSRGDPGVEYEYDDFKGRCEVLEGALNKYSLPADMTFYRFVGYNGIKSLLPPNYQDGFPSRGVDRQANYLNGLSGITLKANYFLSTTTNSELFFGGKNIVLVISAPKGTKGAPLMDYSFHENENEFLINRGQKMSLDGAESDNGQGILKVFLSLNPGG